MKSNTPEQHPKGSDNIRPARKRVQPGTTRTGRLMLIILLVLAVCTCIFMAAIYPMIMVPAEANANIKIPTNATPESVQDSISKYLGEKYARNVLTLAKLRGVAPSDRHGAYTITKGMNALAAARLLTSGAQTPVRITINGFRDKERMLELISAKMEFPVDSLTAAVNDPALLAEYGLTPESALALFLDNTYEAYWTTSARDLVRKIGDSYQYLWSDENTARANDLGLSPAEIMAIASIVDEETNDEEEKGTIGRLYINRINNKMPLQADPTVRFALKDFTIQRISNNDLKTPSPYNTYLHRGVPPGPIRTTSASTVTKILNSKPSNHLYMCAKEDFSGSHNFAATYQEHLDNASRYRAALDLRGITR